MLWAMIPAPVKKALAVAGVIAGVIAAFLLQTLRLRNAQEKVDVLEDYQETRQRMDEADMPADATSAAEWLRRRQRDGHL